MIDIQTVLLLLLGLQLKHFLADFVFQTNQMVVEKGQYGKLHGIYHSSLQGLGTFLATFWINPVLGLVAALVDFAVHYHIDWAKMQIGKRQGYTPADKGFWFWLGFDQLLHQLTYLAIIGWLLGAF